jgi:hypothetical protein
MQGGSEGSVEATQCIYRVDGRRKRCRCAGGFIQDGGEGSVDAAQCNGLTTGASAVAVQVGSNRTGARGAWMQRSVTG